MSKSQKLNKLVEKDFKKLAKQKKNNYLSLNLKLIFVLFCILKAPIKLS